MATYGNEFEQVLGLVTAGTEIMQGRPAQVARGLSTIAARVVKNQDALAEYGITVENVDGSLKSTYDILAELKPKWDEMTDAQRTALGDTLAGTNQYKVLASVLQNFDSALAATETAYNSTGSAAKENARYMDSLEARTQNLKATFQDFANNVVTKEMVANLLDLANGFLTFVNTPFGQAATRIALVTTALTGLAGVLKGYMTFIKYGGVFSGLTNFIGNLKQMSGIQGPDVNVFERLFTIFKNLNPTAIAVTAGVSAFILVIKALSDATDKANRSMADFDKEIESANSQLQTNQDRLAEINAMPWNERTADIIKERQELEAENAALEEQIRLLNEEKIATAEKRTGEGFQFGFTEGGEAYDTMLQYLDDYTAQIEQTGEILDEQRLTYDKTVAAAANQVEMLKLLKDSGHELTDQEEQLIAAYENHMRTVEILGDDNQTLIDAYTSLTNVGHLTEQQYQRLISLYPQLASVATQTADGYIIQKTALENLMSAEVRQQAQLAGVVNGLVAEAKQSGYTQKSLLDLVAAQIQASNTGLNFSQQIAALRQLAIQAGYASAAVANALNAGKIYQQAFVLVANGKYKTIEEAQAALTNSAWGKLTGTAPDTWSTSFGGGSSYTAPSTSSASSAADSARQSQIKALQNERDQIQDTIDAINDKYDAELKAIEEVNDALDDEIELQKILEEMAEAKASKKMVYKDGRFQYVSDMDAVASAQLKLDEYNRKKALKDQKADIERRRQLELQAYNDRLDILDKNIKALQDGFSSELSAWDSYLDELQRKKDRENEILNQGGSSGGGVTPPGGGQTYYPSHEVSAQIKLRNKNLSAKYVSGAGYSDSKNNAYSTSTTKTLQNWYGTTADGIWGRNSYAAAGNRNIASAYGLWLEARNYGYTSFGSFKNAGGYATGTQSARGGLALVGEQGPELRVLNQGDGILPANITRNLWAMATDPQFRNGKMGNTTNTAINVANVTLPNVRNAEDFVAGLKNMAYQRAYARS